MYLYKTSYLRYKHETQRGGRTEQNEQGDYHEGGILLVGYHKRDGGPHDAHQYHVVHTHADIFAVVEGRN